MGLSGLKYVYLVFPGIICFLCCFICFKIVFILLFLVSIWFYLVYLALSGLSDFSLFVSGVIWF